MSILSAVSELAFSASDVSKIGSYEEIEVTNNSEGQRKTYTTNDKSFP